ncbi:MAG: hypothetical protein CMD26_04465 [Flavobacteriales bacterium]|nr:hypothetical protein [Flavobacteriales bacterium]|tara:strand:- start:41833 stop:42663 length:831 start_codon:yes stop_codon:yes gene_type:complete
MIYSKIKKHLSITLNRLNQTRVLKLMNTQQHPTLNNIVDAFLETKHVLHTEKDLQLFQDCENYRTQLLTNKNLISYDVFGSSLKNPVYSICEKASSKPIWGQFLYKLIKNNNSKNVLEMGTNLGVSGSYILNALKDTANSHFISMEGVPDLCNIASQQFNSINPKTQHSIIQGLYDKTFAELYKKKIKFNLCFIDGNHQKDPTIDYFQNLKSRLDLPAIMIFDDINWSNDMQSAWEIIKSDQDVCYSIDLFKWGIIIIDNSVSDRNIHFNLHLSYS